MKPAVDEMFPEGAGPYVDLDEAGGSTGLLMDLAANEKAVHADFFNGKDTGMGVPVLIRVSVVSVTSRMLCDVGSGAEDRRARRVRISGAEWFVR
uniref:COP9 signalosome complex subunit 9 n=1 Tax=Suricata suricatta TaxID=37032 RepID=A0A673T053_SURSU